MFFLYDHLPPRIALGALLIAHLAIFVDIAIRRDLPWGRKLIIAILVGLLMPFGALLYLLFRPVGARMRERIRARSVGRRERIGWPSVAARILSVIGVVLAFVASVVASAAATVPPSPFAGQDYGVNMLSLPTAWPTSTGKGVVVAVVDSGIDTGNAFLAPRLVAGHDFADGTGSVMDEVGHGTHVAGIVAQTAPDAQLMPVKVLGPHGSANVGQIAQGVRWAADHGAEVINLSVDESGVLAQIQKEGSLNGAVKYANAHGAVVVTAAGNEHQHLQVYQSGVPSITVAAVDQNGQPASFTNWGGPSEVAAPGVDIWSTAPTHPTELFPDGTDGSGQLSGTSMATPFVAGVAALLRSTGASVAATEAALLHSAKPVPGTDHLGHGIVDGPVALAYAKAHPNSHVAREFAPSWFQVLHAVLLAAVAIRFATIGVIALGKRRRRTELAADQ